MTQLSPDDDPIPLLTDILLYHVSPEEAALDELNAEGPVPTLLDGARVELTGGTVVDGDPDYQDADVISADIAVPGGTVQVVDQILLPVDTPAVSDAPTLLGVPADLPPEVEEDRVVGDDDEDDVWEVILGALGVAGLVFGLTLSAG